MERVKIFYLHLGLVGAEAEKVVNEWLLKNRDKIHITRATQSSTNIAGAIILTIFYTELHPPGRPLPELG